MGIEDTRLSRIDSLVELDWIEDCHQSIAGLIGTTCEEESDSCVLGPIEKTSRQSVVLCNLHPTQLVVHAWRPWKFHFQVSLHFIYQFERCLTFLWIGMSQG